MSAIKDDRRLRRGSLVAPSGGLNPNQNLLEDL